MMLGLGLPFTSAQTLVSLMASSSVPQLPYGCLTHLNPSSAFSEMSGLGFRFLTAAFTLKFSQYKLISPLFLFLFGSPSVLEHLSFVCLYIILCNWLNLTAKSKLFFLKLSCHLLVIRTDGTIYYLKWDVLSHGKAVQEVTRISNGQHPGNCISLLQVVF